MKAIVVGIALLAACGETPGGTCTIDADCVSGETCARNDVCYPTSEVRSVRAEWTVNGQVASEASCVGEPNLAIYFSSGSTTDSFGFAPVPCKAGRFTIDKLPTSFTRAELGPEDGSTISANVDSDGVAKFDL